MNAEADQPRDDAPAIEATTEGGRDARDTRGRRYGTRALVALGTLLLILGVFAVWIERVALNEDNWSNTSGKLIDDPVIQQTLGTYVVDQVYDNVDVAGQIRSVLPPRLQPLAAPAAAGLQTQAQGIAVRLLGRPRVQQAWRAANRIADRQLIKVVENKGSAVDTANGQVTIDLRPIVQQVVGRVGLADRLNGQLPPDAGRIVLLKSKQLDTAQKAVRVLRAISSLLVAIVILIFAIAIWIAPSRRRALRACAIGMIVAALVLIFVRRVVGNQLIERLVPDETFRPAVHRVWWIATDSLRLATTSILFVGIVALLGAWIAGHGARATSLRGWLAPYLRDPLLAFGVLAAIILLLVVWSPTPAASNWVTVIILSAAAALGLEVLRRQAAREFPDAEKRPLTFRRSPVAAPAPVLSPDESRLERLGRLGELHSAGVLDDAEFAREKERVLAGSSV